MAEKQVVYCDLCPADAPTIIVNGGLRFRLDVVLTRISARRDAPALIEKLDVCEGCAPQLVEKLRR